jgi:hypothetical protein
MVESEVPSSGFTNAVASESPNDLMLSFDPLTNTLQASITVRDVQNGDTAADAYIFGFGDSPQDPQNLSSYIDDQLYAAIENTSGTTVLRHNNPGAPEYQNVSATSYFVSGEQLNATAFFPETFGEPDENGIGQPFCTGCEFLQWGAWGSRVSFGNGESGPQYVDNIHLGWWVAGDIATDTDLDALQALDASATYQGHVIGNVANNLDDGGWNTYVATGDLEMNWAFASRTGDLTISKFDTQNFNDGLTFSGPMCAPGVYGCGTGAGNHFGGPLNTPQGSPIALTGSAAGSFVNNGAAKAAAVVGNWNIGGAGYKATGILAGSGIPQIPGN